jgi:hypothetical protein
VRDVSPHLDEDRSLAPEIGETARMIRAGGLIEAVSGTGLQLL